MPAKAGISSTYRWRLALIAAMCLGWACWSAYDGFVAYPAHNQKVEAFQNLKADTEAHPEKHPDGFGPEWDRIAAEHHWTTEDPGQRKGRTDIVFQHGMILLTLPIGLFYLVNYLTSFRKWVASDEQGLLNSGGQRAAFAAITRLDTRQWKRKGKASVYYHDAGGSEKRFKLDDWIYEAPPTLVMLKEVESRLKPEQITGGPAEAVEVPTPSV
jgi:hypothetical protein